MEPETTAHPVLDILNTQFHKYVSEYDAKVNSVKFVVSDDEKGSLLSFSLSIPHEHTQTGANIVISAASVGDTSLVDVANVRWVFFETKHPRNLPQTIEQFLQWWMYGIPEKINITEVSAILEVGLPDDVVAEILRCVDVLTHSKLSIASKSWKAVVDREEEWKKMWIQMPSQALGIASLSSCPSFKARVGLVHRARENMKKGRATMVALVQGVQCVASGYATVYPATFSQTGNSHFTGFQVMESQYAGSYDVIKVVQQVAFDLAHFPQLERRELKRPHPSSLSQVGEGLIFDRKSWHIADLNSFFRSAEAPDSEYPQLTPSIIKPKLYKRYSEVIPNTDSRYPWIMIYDSPFADGDAPATYTLYDMSRSITIFRAFATHLGDTTIYSHSFVGLWYLAATSDSYILFRVAEADQQLQLVAQLSRSSLAGITGDSIDPVNFICSIFSSKIFFACRLGMSSKVHIYWCDISKMQGAKEGYQKELRQNHMLVPGTSDGELALFASERTLFASVGSQIYVVIDMTTKEVLNTFFCSHRLHSVNFIDETLVQIVTSTQVFLLDFACRGESDLPASLPTYQRYLYTFDAKGSLDTIVYPQGRLRDTIAYLLGSDWEAKCECSTVRTPSEQGLSILRPGVYMIRRNMNQAPIQKYRGVEFVNMINRFDTTATESLDDTLACIDPADVPGAERKRARRFGVRRLKTHEKPPISTVVKTPQSPIEMLFFSVYHFPG